MFQGSLREEKESPSDQSLPLGQGSVSSARFCVEGANEAGVYFFISFFPHFFLKSLATFLTYLKYK